MASVQSVASTTGFTTTAATLTFSKTNAAGATLLHVIVSCSGDASSTTLSATYNGTAMTSKGKQASNNTPAGGFVQLFELVNPTADGAAHDVAVSGAGVGADVLGNAISFTSADASTSITTTGGTAEPATGSETPASNEVAFQYLCRGNPWAITAQSHTERFEFSLNSNSGAGNLFGQTADGSGAAVNFSVTNANSDWWGQITGIVPNQAGGGGGPAFVLAKEGGGFILSEAGVPLG